eukprot:GHVU01189439.1.p3 GENE.GHVU01189439.1~~GHVU01189439.1.p3  ORF type:complete len:117 (+),score=5.01 GHVU01189439.1:662-1012(+)
MIPYHDMRDDISNSLATHRYFTLPLSMPTCLISSLFASLSVPAFLPAYLSGDMPTCVPACCLRRHRSIDRCIRFRHNGRGTGLTNIPKHVHAATSEIDRRVATTKMVVIGATSRRP